MENRLFVMMLNILFRKFYKVLSLTLPKNFSIKQISKLKLQSRVKILLPKIWYKLLYLFFKNHSNMF
jgi:hypothetical protein